MEGGGASIACASVLLWRIDFPGARRFPQILFPCCNSGIQLSSQVTKQAAASSFVFVVIFHRAPK